MDRIQDREIRAYVGSPSNLAWPGARELRRGEHIWVVLKDAQIVALEKGWLWGGRGFSHKTVTMKGVCVCIEGYCK